MKQFIGKYYDGYNSYILIMAEDSEDAKSKLDAYLYFNKIEHIPISAIIHPIVASLT